MGDMRFIMLGVALIFAGFVILGGFGHGYQAATIESDEFGTCHRFSGDAKPVKVDCSSKVFEQTLFFAAVAGFVGAGAVCLAKFFEKNKTNQK